MGRLRLKVAETLDLIDKDALNFLWVVHFPMFEKTETAIMPRTTPLRCLKI